MKTLKVKSVLFSLLAIMAVAVFMTSCEQDTVLTPAIEEATQAEKEEAQAQYDLIASYGAETLAAYEAHLAGEELSYFSPIGVKESTEFDWANYSSIMEHSKIVTAALKSGKMDVYNQNVSQGTYLTKADVQELTPELMPLIDNPVALPVVEDRCGFETGWYDCGPCKTYWASIWRFSKLKEQCNHVSPCNAPCYTKKRKVNC